jgi:hypothetical protein
VVRRSRNPPRRSATGHRSQRVMLSGANCGPTIALAGPRIAWSTLTPTLSWGRGGIFVRLPSMRTPPVGLRSWLQKTKERASHVATDSFRAKAGGSLSMNPPICRYRLLLHMQQCFVMSGSWSRCAIWESSRLPRSLPGVAQVGNLLCRRLGVGWPPRGRTAADCQSAAQQTASLRYGSRAQGAQKIRSGLSWGERVGVRASVDTNFVEHGSPAKLAVLDTPQNLILHSYRLPGARVSRTTRTSPDGMARWMAVGSRGSSPSGVQSQAATTRPGPLYRIVAISGTPSMRGGSL